MKLDQAPGVLAVLVVFATGCGARGPSPRPISAPSNPVSTVHLMAAELRVTDDAPKVGKSQHSDSSVVDEDEGKKEPPHGRSDRKRGGFSGYK
jgi:hypothetical protein